MVRCIRFSFIFLLIAVFPNNSHSQGPTELTRALDIKQDTLNFPNYTSVVFDKNLNTYRWNGGVVYERDLGSISLGFNEHFLSSLIRTDQDLTRDEQSLNLSVRKRFSERLNFGAKVSSLSVSDNKSLLLGNTASHAFYGGIGYEPVDHIHVEPFLGVRFDNQFNERDKGLSYFVNLASDSLDYNGYRTHINGMIQYDYLTPRRLQSRSGVISIGRNFFEQTRNVFQFQYYGNHRDFYFPADVTVQQQFHVLNNIETRTEDAAAVSDSLDYAAEKNLLLSFQGNIFSRSIGRETQYRSIAPGQLSSLNTTIDELKIDGGVKASYSGGNDFGGSIGFYYQERTERHGIQADNSISQNELDQQTHKEELKNNHSRRTSLASTLNTALSQSHAVSLSGSISLLRYDTPSTANDDDRDELRYIFNVTSVHRINTHIDMTITADASLTHLVYLASSRSANNTWNRILRLSPRVLYVPAKEFSTVNTFEVLANYTAYDIEYLSASRRSIVFRQFSFVDSSHVDLTGRLSVDWFSSIRLYEQGELRWNAFTERPVNYFEDKTYSGKIDYAIHRGLIFSVGIRYFSQLRFEYAGSSRNLQGFLRSVGPITNIFWNAGKQTELSITGWYESQTQTGVSTRIITNMTMSLIVRI